MFGVTRKDDRGALLIGCRETEEGAKKLQLGDALSIVAPRFPGMAQRVLAARNGQSLREILTPEEADAVARVAIGMYVIERLG